MKSKVLCSTGAFIGRVNGRNYKLIVENAQKIHCDGFEFMLYPSWYDVIDQLVYDLKTADIAFPVVHVDKQVGEMISRNENNYIESALDLFDKNCRIAKVLGSEKLVLHLWGGIPSDRDNINNIEQFKRLNAISKSYDLLLTVENVVCNQQDPMTHLKELQRCYPNISFTFDTKMAAFHSQLQLVYENEWKWLWEGNHIRHLHINDYCGGHMNWKCLKALHIGEGNIDFDEFFTFLRSKNYSDTITVESTSMRKDGSIEIEKLNRSLDYIYRKLDLNKEHFYVSY
ncbi:sugar phosphate isomerase/epimerase [Clostridium sp.]|uniref:sugar phosphate isomerase/epimerase family protein n=1 Tax=Clostridium sp. TaxID=1506 RepID=UPI0026139DFE|nr:sugar phosphate isomerase/epimerase [Clostridium sp.]